MDPIRPSKSPESENQPQKNEITKAAREKLDLVNHGSSWFSWFDRTVIWIKESWIGKWVLSCFYPKGREIQDAPDLPFPSKLPIPPPQALESPPKESPPSPPSNPTSPIKSPNGSPIHSPKAPQIYRRTVSLGDGIDESEVLAPVDLTKPLWLYEAIAVKTLKGYYAGWPQRNYKPGEHLYDNKLLISNGKIVKFVDVKDLYYTTASFKFKIGDRIEKEEIDPLTLVSFAGPGLLLEHKGKIVRVIDRKPHDMILVFDGSTEFETHMFNLRLLKY